MFSKALHGKVLCGSTPRQKLGWSGYTTKASSSETSLYSQYRGGLRNATECGRSGGWAAEPKHCYAYGLMSPYHGV